MTGWFAAAYVWRKELPDLSAELAKVHRTRQTLRQSNEQLHFEMHQISAMLGVPIQEKRAR